MAQIEDVDKAFEDNIEGDWNVVFNDSTADVLKYYNPQEYDRRRNEFISENLFRCADCGEYFDDETDLNDDNICYDCAESQEE